MALTQGDLDHFIGTTQWFKHFLGYLYTEGVRHVAEEGEAYWLLDAIFSWQTPTLKSYEHQFWSLTVTLEDETRNATLQCVSDTLPYGEILATQEIGYTDFPMDHIELWFANNVLYLPSEH